MNGWIMYCFFALRGEKTIHVERIGLRRFVTMEHWLAL
jgi:hypothetical protein